MNTHILKCPQILALKASRANQTLLSFPTVEGAGLTTVSSRFNQLACRKALATYIILDEQPVIKFIDVEVLTRSILLCSVVALNI
jgi:hypothetical protein